MITGDRSLAQGKRGAFYNTLEEFHKHWERIDIICPNVSGQRTTELFGNVVVHPSPWPLIFQPFWISKQGRRLFREQRFDIMTVHEYPPFYNGLGAWLLHRITGLPYMLEVMHVPGFPKAGNLKERFYRWLMWSFIKYDARPARAVRVINKKQTPGFLVQAGVPKEKIIDIPAFYIDLAIFQPQMLEKKYDAIFVGRLVENKGVYMFLDAVKKSGATALLVGTGPELSGIKKYIAHHDLSHKVTIHGWARDHQEVASLLNRSRVLIMPSFNEGGPRVVLEAMACGVPVLATPVGIVPDIVPQQNHIPWDGEKIAQSLKHLLTDEQVYHQASEQGLQTASLFEKEKAIRNYAEQIQKLV